MASLCLLAVSLGSAREFREIPRREWVGGNDSLAASPLVFTASPLAQARAPLQNRQLRRLENGQDLSKTLFFHFFLSEKLGYSIKRSSLRSSW